MLSGPGAALADWGASSAAPGASAAGAPSALFFETLAERTLAFAQRAKLADPDKGYTPDLEGYLRPVLKDCVTHGIPILGNFGAANPLGAAVRNSFALAAGAGRADDFVPMLSDAVAAMNGVKLTE